MNRRHRCQASPIDDSTCAVWAGDARSSPANASELCSAVGAVSKEWPLISTVEFCSSPTAASCARTHAELVLAEWGLGHLVDDAKTLVSELLTNALRASWAQPGSPPVTLRLLADRHALLVEAWDQCVESYDLTHQPASDAEHGRGLMVIAALSKRWGVRRAGIDYKVVWCELEVSTPTP